MTDLTEREALALEMHRTSAHPGGYGWQAYLPMADRVLAAGFRRQGPITDAQVEAARFAYAGERVNQSLRVGTEPNTVAGRAEKSRAAMRAALEAAVAADRSE
jgi:hypothetical protein